MRVIDPGGWPIVKLFNRLGRYMIGFLLIHDAHAWRVHGAPPPTLSRLQASCPLSPRQTASIVGGLRAGRLIAAERASDGRSHILIPAPALTEVIARSMLAYLRAADELEQPHRARAAAFECDTAMCEALIHCSAAFVLANGTLLDDFPRVREFATRDCGYLVLTEVMSAIYAELRGEPVRILSCRGLAESLRISRSHINNLLALAQQERWFVIGYRGRLDEVDPAFVAEFEQWSSVQLAHNASIADAVLGM